MTRPRGDRGLPPVPGRVDWPEQERVRVELDGQEVTLPRDYLEVRRRALIQELNALNESLGIRRTPKEPERVADDTV